MEMCLMAAPLENEIAAFEANKQQLEQEHMGEWVLIHESTIVGFFSDLDSAASEAVAKFGHGPYLIRQIGAQPMVMPASAMYVFGAGAR
jgi:hypothetical protein